jgi:hypothetical protein
VNAQDLAQKERDAWRQCLLDAAHGADPAFVDPDNRIRVPYVFPDDA